MLTPNECTPEALGEYVTKLASQRSETLSDDQLRIILLARVVKELGLKLAKIGELLDD